MFEVYRAASERPDTAQFVISQHITHAEARAALGAAYTADKRESNGQRPYWAIRYNPNVTPIPQPQPTNDATTPRLKRTRKEG